MSVELRPSSLGPVYTIRYRDATGRQIRETLGLKEEGWTHRKAKEVERARRVSSRGNGVRRPVPDFIALAWLWYDETGFLRAWKPRTERAYKRGIERLDFFHKMRVDQIRPKHVAEYIAKAGKTYSAKTINFDISVLYAIMDYGILHELIVTNPAAKAPRPKNGKKKWRILTPQEIQAVDKAFDDVEFESEEDRTKARLIFRVLVRTGIRRHELRNLRVRDIDFDRNVIRITDSKTEEGVRSIAIPVSLTEQLKEWVKRG